MALSGFTFSDVYHRNAEFFPDRTAFVFEGRRISHCDYLGRIQPLAAGLVREGVKPGDRVAILSQNSLEMIDLIGAVAMLGAILLPVNFRLNAEEIGFVLADGAPVLVIAGPEYQETIAGLASTLPFVRKFFAIGTAAAPFSRLPNSPAERGRIARNQPRPEWRLRHHSHAAVGAGRRGRAAIAEPIF